MSTRSQYQIDNLRMAFGARDVERSEIQSVLRSCVQQTFLLDDVITLAAFTIQIISDSIIAFSRNFISNASGMIVTVPRGAAAVLGTGTPASSLVSALQQDDPGYIHPVQKTGQMQGSPAKVVHAIYTISAFIYN